jgi:hypothetical protein
LRFQERLAHLTLLGVLLELEVGGGFGLRTHSVHVEHDLHRRRSQYVFLDRARTRRHSLADASGREQDEGPELRALPDILFVFLREHPDRGVEDLDELGLRARREPTIRMLVKLRVDVLSNLLDGRLSLFSLRGWLFLARNHAIPRRPRLCR